MKLGIVRSIVMKKIVDYSLIILSLVVAVICFLSFDLEGILWDFEKHDVIDSKRINENRAVNYTGFKRGEGIKIIRSKDDWEDILNDIDYVTVVPKNIMKTDVYSLAKWKEKYTRRYNGTTGRKLSEVRKTTLDISADYSPYYIIELDDNTHILAQMNRGIAKKIENGEKVELPIGKKIGFSQSAKAELSQICKKMNVSTDYVLYTINDNWQKKHVNIILCGKILVSIIILFVLAVVLQLIADKILFDRNKKS